MEAPSISGSSKRARAPGNMMTQVAHCLVDGCNADLSLCRDYHRRHKVCEMHSKTPKVTIAGREQRFCQQCSRFHSLVEFDEGKRSCRKRLDGHNRRRRKPQPDSVVSRNPSSGLINHHVFSTQQASVLAGTLVSFNSSPQILPSSAVIKNNDMLVCNNHQKQQLNYNSFPENSCYKEAVDVNQFHFLQNNLLDPMDGASSGRSQEMLSDGGLNQVVGSDRALSLLSSAPTTPVTREFGSNHMVHHPPQSHNYMMHYCGLGHNNNPFAQESKPRLASAHGNDVSTPHFLPEMFQHGPTPQGSPTSGSHQKLTFMWE